MAATEIFWSGPCPLCSLMFFVIFNGAATSRMNRGFMSWNCEDIKQMAVTTHVGNDQGRTSHNEVCSPRSGNASLRSWQHLKVPASRQFRLFPSSRTIHMECLNLVTVSSFLPVFTFNMLQLDELRTLLSKDKKEICWSPTSGGILNMEAFLIAYVATLLIGR